MTATFKAILLSAGLALLPNRAGADMIRMRDYNLLTRGMTEAEVLYRVGGYDHESVYTDYHHNIMRKVWYYIPDRHRSDAWITEIEFDHNGVVQSLQRYRARK
ncbi:MAG: hypothetical protein ACREUU_05540 [Gammaproteobacteria bacterium]